MKKLLIKVTLATLATGWLVSANAEGNIISGGVSGFAGAGSSGSSTSATVVKVEYERKFTDLITLTGGLAHLSYTTTNTNYNENGSGTGAFVDMNFYPMKNALKGLYVGPGVGVTSISSNWSDSSTFPTTNGTGSATAWDVHAKAGWKFNAGGVVIDPNVRLGYFLNSPTGGANAQYNLGIYLLLGVNVGVPF